MPKRTGYEKQTVLHRSDKEEDRQTGRKDERIYTRYSSTSSPPSLYFTFKYIYIIYIYWYIAYYTNYEAISL